MHAMTDDTLIQVPVRADRTHQIRLAPKPERPPISRRMALPTAIVGAVAVVALAYVTAPAGTWMDVDNGTVVDPSTSTTLGDGSTYLEQPPTAVQRPEAADIEPVPARTAGEPTTPSTEQPALSTPPPITQETDVNADHPRPTNPGPPSDVTPADPEGLQEELAALPDHLQEHEPPFTSTPTLPDPTPPTTGTPTPSTPSTTTPSPA